jgi:hypothetical protein
MGTVTATTDMNTVPIAIVAAGMTIVTTTGMNMAVTITIIKSFYLVQ